MFQAEETASAKALRQEQQSGQCGWSRVSKEGGGESGGRWALRVTPLQAGREAQRAVSRGGLYPDSGAHSDLWPLWEDSGGGRGGASQRSMPRQWPERTVMEDRAPALWSPWEQDHMSDSRTPPSPITPISQCGHGGPELIPRRSPEHLRPKAVTLGRLGASEKPSRSRMAYVSANFSLLDHLGKLLW